MPSRSTGLILLSLLLFFPGHLVAGVEEDYALTLPAGIKAVWNLDRAWRETTPTREKICLNGLWRWQPAQPADSQVPTNHWGYFKVPGSWPGITDYMQKDFQTVHAHPAWKSQRLAELSAAWSERTLDVPAGWAGRRISLKLEHLNSFAAVYLDGIRRGELSFPGGELDLTDHLQPGRSHRLSLLVVALPLKGVLVSYTDSNAARVTKGPVERRGLCGDVVLTSTPIGARFSEAAIQTSVRQSKIAFDTGLQQLQPGRRYSIRTRLHRDQKMEREFTSPLFSTSDLAENRFQFS